MAAISLMAAFGVWAVLTGQISYVVTYGISMNPLYYAGDLVIVVKHDSYHVGQIVAYHGSQPGQKVLHRIVGGDAEHGFIFKGDNNHSIDSLHPTGDRLIGRATIHVPKGGLWLSPLFSPTGLGMLGFLIISSGTVARSKRDTPRGRRKKKVRAMARAGSVTALWVMLSRLPPKLRAAAIGIGAVGIVALGLGVIAYSGPVTRTLAVDPATVTSIAFSYSASVPRSAAYDGTVARSPDPIFRKLADHVDLHLLYHGRPGTLRRSIELSTMNGWHTTFSAGDDRQLSGRDNELTTTLDLGAFDKRAADAAKAIGVDPGQLSIQFNAHVGGFGASLPLQMSATQLTLGTGGSWVQQDTPAKPVEARDLSLLGHAIMTVAKARTYCVLLVFLMLGGVVGLMLALRKATPLRTRSEIERRYPQLLVAVEPAVGAEQPVINVDDFQALAKLAEKYGQMVLTWSDPDADEFVVRDDGVTYRYRAEAQPDDETRINLDARSRGAQPAPVEDESQPTGR